MASRKIKEPAQPRIPIAIDPDRLSAGARRISTRCHRVFKQFVQDERVPSGVAFFTDDGARLDADACEELIRKGRLQPCGDSLFPEASSQTFEAI